jgi:mono/diheme cytochrome c family protein
MNYPVWDVPASGLLIAFIAIVHVFVSHFAVGGGLFLVAAERKARREGDTALLGYVRLHSRFFILLTLVFGAITGVGIWFVIGLVHPQATSALISTFVWGWAIEWTFFVAEVAAAMVYYYGWDRLTPRAHQAVGWIYVANAWLSLVIINGILTFMLTPGTWVQTREFWDGFFNPTYWPGVVARTFAAVGLAGLYALLTASWLDDAALKEKVARYAGWTWIVPMAVALPLSLAWYLAAASGAGVPVGEILGAPGQGTGAVVGAVFGGSPTGQPVAMRATAVTLVAACVLALLTIVLVQARSRTYRWPAAAVLMTLGLVAMGGGEWLREGLRKPYVLGQVMFVNGVRLPPPAAAPAPPATHVAVFGSDRFTPDALHATGVRAASAWLRPVPPDLMADHDYPARAEHQGRELFRALCASCHTVDGYVAVRPLVAGKNVAALDGMLAKLAMPVDAAGAPAAWNAPDLRLRTWRDRRMPPFTGTDEERRLLAVYLALLGGASPSSITADAAAPAGVGQAFYDSNCAACHAPDAMAPFDAKGRAAAEFYEMIGRLPAISEAMPPFEGTDAERRALSEYLTTLGPSAPKGGAR